MKKLTILLLVIIVAMAGVFLLSPYYALYQIKSAYESHDYGKALSYVNFDKVQAGVKSELTARLDTTLMVNQDIQAIAQLFPQVKDELTSKVKAELDSSVKTTLTANNVEKLLNNEINDDSKKLVAIWAFASDYVDYGALIKDAMLGGGDMEKAIKNQEPIVKKRIAERAGQVPDDVQSQYCGLNCFEVKGGVNGVPIGVTMARVGLIDWQIEQVVLP